MSAGSKNLGMYRCSVCHQTGHNAASCGKVPTPAPVPPATPTPVTVPSPATTVPFFADAAAPSPVSGNGETETGAGGNSVQAGSMTSEDLQTWWSLADPGPPVPPDHRDLHQHGFRHKYIDQMETYAKKVVEVITNSNATDRDVYGFLTAGGFTRDAVERSLANLPEEKAKQMLGEIVNIVSEHKVSADSTCLKNPVVPDEKYAWFVILRTPFFPTSVIHPKNGKDGMSYDMLCEARNFFSVPSTSREIVDVHLLNCVINSDYADDAMMERMVKIFSAEEDPNGDRFRLCRENLARSGHTPTVLLDRIALGGDGVGIDEMTLLTGNDKLSRRGVANMWQACRRQYQNSDPYEQGKLWEKISRHPNASLSVRVNIRARVWLWRFFQSF